MYRFNNVSEINKYSLLKFYTWCSLFMTSISSKFHEDQREVLFGTTVIDPAKTIMETQLIT